MSASSVRSGIGGGLPADWSAWPDDEVMSETKLEDTAINTKVDAAVDTAADANVSGLDTANGVVAGETAKEETLDSVQKSKQHNANEVMESMKDMNDTVKALMELQNGVLKKVQEDMRVMMEAHNDVMPQLVNDGKGITQSMKVLHENVKKNLDLQATTLQWILDDMKDIKGLKDTSGIMQRMRDMHQTVRDLMTTQNSPELGTPGPLGGHASHQRCHWDAAGEVDAGHEFQERAGHEEGR